MKTDIFFFEASDFKFPVVKIDFSPLSDQRRLWRIIFSEISNFDENSSMRILRQKSSIFHPVLQLQETHLLLHRVPLQRLDRRRPVAPDLVSSTIRGGEFRLGGSRSGRTSHQGFRRQKP